MPAVSQLPMVHAVSQVPVVHAMSQVPVVPAVSQVPVSAVSRVPVVQSIRCLWCLHAVVPVVSHVLLVHAVSLLSHTLFS